MDLNEVLAKAFRRHAEAPALLSQDGQILSFAKLSHTVSVLAARLRAEGVEPGQCIGVVTDNRALRIALLLALMRLGPDIAFVSALGALARRGQRIDAVIRFADQKTDGAQRSIVFSQDWLNGEPDPNEKYVNPGTLALSTSGSTGEPRYVRINPQTYFGMLDKLDDGTGPSIGSVMMSIPETAPFSIFMLIRALVAGHGFAGMSPSGAETLRECARFGVREMMVTPLALNELVMAAEAGAPKGDLARICVFGSVAEPALLARAENAFGSAIYIACGATEIGQTSFGRFDPATYVTGWSGKPVAITEFRIGDNEPAGTSGRLYLRLSTGPLVDGYIGGPPAFDPDGWFDTGDIARIERDGTLMIEGRADNVINLGGSKFAAERIETLAGLCPGVVMCAAVGLLGSDGMAPELGVAVLPSTGFDPDYLRNFLTEHLRTSARIRIKTSARLPSLPTGKLDRTAVASLFQ
ncbi:MAG: AMP-binding protein [Alphaproteobacteria bacterium]|nr:AMP-binding protein [Alphaproteobacteria bacterium]